jgi:hypothetical protein
MERKQETSGKTIITIPKGKVLKDFNFFCKKHGNLGGCTSNPAVIVSKINYVDPTGVKQEKQEAFCMACLAEYLESLQKRGFLSPVAIVPIVANAEETKKAPDTHHATSDDACSTTAPSA